MAKALWAGAESQIVRAPISDAARSKIDALVKWMAEHKGARSGEVFVSERFFFGHDDHAQSDAMILLGGTPPLSVCVYALAMSKGTSSLSSCLTDHNGETMELRSMMTDHHGVIYYVVKSTGPVPRLCDHSNAGSVLEEIVKNGLAALRLMYADL